MTTALPVPCWIDNYAWILPAHDRTAVVVDPTDAAPIAAALRGLGRRLVAVLCTHHHPDHVAGLQALLAEFPEAAVFASEHDAEGGRIPVEAIGVADGAELALHGLTITAHAAPAHTLGAIVWMVDGMGAFVGDTLFAAGCGRLFEGSAEQLDHALYSVIGGLSNDVALYCGHEYTEGNLAFAMEVEPANEAIPAALERARLARSSGRATVPTTLGDERSYNPFLRCDEPSVRSALGFDRAAPRAQVLGALRARKDRWRAA